MRRVALGERPPNRQLVIECEGSTRILELAGPIVGRVRDEGKLLAAFRVHGIAIEHPRRERPSERGATLLYGAGRLLGRGTARFQSLVQAKRADSGRSE